MDFNEVAFKQFIEGETTEEKLEKWKNQYENNELTFSNVGYKISFLNSLGLKYSELLQIKVASLKQGSTIGELTGKITDGWLSVRNSLSVENHILKEDVECDSPSMASSIVVGHASNGWDLWKTSSGEKIDMYRKHSQED